MAAEKREAKAVERANAETGFGKNRKVFGFSVVLLGLFACSPPQPGSRETAVVAVADPADAPHYEVVGTGYEVPWGLDELPNGELVVAERNGTISLLNPKNGEKTLLGQRPALDQGEGGLLGLAVDPDFSQTGWVYCYETHRESNRIVRLKLADGQLAEEKILLDGIPKARFHNGGILRFGPDGWLYAGTGDGRNPEFAQDPESLAGKILRMTRDGQPAPGNPFGDLVYSSGHRNVQGLAWDSSGQLYATEHGPSGEINGWCCHDEVNRIVAGGNYGWPKVIGSDDCADCIPPLAHSGRDTWAPGGCIILRGSEWENYEGQLLLAALRGMHLRTFALQEQNTGRSGASSVWFPDELGRLRNVFQSSDGSVYFCSSNRDGRGRPLDGDDKIYRLIP